VPLSKWEGAARCRHSGDPRIERLPNQLEILDSAVARRRQQPRRHGNAEAKIQASIVAWVRLVAPELLIFAVPNGGLRSKAEAARMKWTGVLAGIPDFAIVTPGGRVHFIEVKTPATRLSPEQRAIHDALITLGTPPAICRSIEDARNTFVAWGVAAIRLRPIFD
jgi:hypothetical protein